MCTSSNVTMIYICNVLSAVCDTVSRIYYCWQIAIIVIHFGSASHAAQLCSTEAWMCLHSLRMETKINWFRARPIFGRKSARARTRIEKCNIGVMVFETAWGFCRRKMLELNGNATILRRMNNNKTQRNVRTLVWPKWLSTCERALCVAHTHTPALVWIRDTLHNIISMFCARKRSDRHTSRARDDSSNFIRIIKCRRIVCAGEWSVGNIRQHSQPSTHSNNRSISVRSTRNIIYMHTGIVPTRSRAPRTPPTQPRNQTWQCVRVNGCETKYICTDIHTM